ncbi:hypothetical protein D3C73_859050 [compost metagenome]
MNAILPAMATEIPVRITTLSIVSPLITGTLSPSPAAVSSPSDSIVTGRDISRPSVRPTTANGIASLISPGSIICSLALYQKLIFCEI